MGKKSNSEYICQGCGLRSSKWLGRCPDCGNWDSFVEEVQAARAGRPAAPPPPAGGAGPVPFDQISGEEGYRLPTGVAEFDRVLGGGVVPGSLVLLGGEPGVGKSTLLLQIAAAVGSEQTPVLYVTGEESARQVKLRGQRLGIRANGLFVLPETCLERVEQSIAGIRPALVIVDSIQTLYTAALESTPGGIGQIRECAARLLLLAKEKDVPVFLIGHITKEGAIAGPKALEHIVDTVLYFEGERHLNHRVIRAVKNRFGATSELALFEMTGAGLVPVENPSAFFLAGRRPDVPGTAVVCGLEGSRPLLVEVQALVSVSGFASGRRMAQGFDRNRLSLLLAMLEKVAGIDVLGADVYLNVAGGITLDEPAADLGAVAAVVSSLRGRPIGLDCLMIGEVGLGGEVRAVSQPLPRVKEAAAMGFCRCFLPAGNLPLPGTVAGIETVAVNGINPFLDALF